MSSPQETMHCPTDENLAAFTDGRLEGEARERVVEHLAMCDSCHAVWQTAAEFREAEVPAGSNVVKAAGRFGFGAAFAAAMAAAIGAMLFLTPIREKLPFFKPTGMERFIAATSVADYRPFEPRLSGDFPYKPKKAVMRGGEMRGGDDESIDFALAAAEVIEEKNADPRARAAALLIQKDWDGAVKTLEHAVMAATDTKNAMEGIAKSTDATLLNDLSVAYLLRGKSSSGADAETGVPQESSDWIAPKPFGDFSAARITTDRAWSLERTPVIAFNRALIIEKHQPNEAKEAWTTYLSLDSTSPWADEARKKLDELG